MEDAVSEGPTSQELEVDPGAGPVESAGIDPEAPLDAPEPVRDAEVQDADREVPVPTEEEQPDPPDE
jgi:hypothetical protein